MSDGSRWGESSAWSIGVEEEVMIVDAETLAQVPAVDVLVQEAAGLELPGRLKTELLASVVELNTGICETAAGALDALVRLRAEATQIAERHGLRLMAAATHPLSVPEAQEIRAEERYRRFVEYVGITARRQGVNGLHVHVGMPSGDACFTALERILPWLPVVLALSANSPYLAGRETGLVSARAELLGALPRSGAPPVFGSYSGWERFVSRVRDSGLPLADDYTSFWWDVRPHPRFGTLEIRMPDQPTSVELSGALVALLQALCCKIAAEPDGEARPAERGDFQQNRWAASRFGPNAELIHPDGERTMRAAELARELLERVAGVADELGSASLLAGIDPDTCEATEQLAVGRANGLGALCRDLVRRTLRSE